MTPGAFDYVITNVDKEQAIKEFFKILTDVSTMLGHACSVCTLTTM